MKFEIQNRSLSPEAGLVLLSSSTRVAPERAARIVAVLEGQLDWDLVLRMALLHGVMPLLYRHLSGTCPDLVPEVVLERLKRDFYGNSLRTRYLSAELVRLASLFESQGIVPIAYKGPTLAKAAYGDIALRQFTDLDILVRRSDFPAAAAILTREGYRQKFDCKALETGFFQATKDVFAHPDGLRQIDLHWGVTPRYFPFAPDLDSLWSRAQRVALDGGNVLAPSPQDLMLALCAHACRHGWNCLTLVCDIAELLRSRPDIDWGETVEAATKLGNRRMVILALCLARDLVGAELPSNLMQAVNGDRAVVSLATEIERRLFARPPKEDELFQPWLIPLRTIERTRDRIRYCVDRALAPTVDDARFVSLPRPLLPLFYVVRPFRLAFQQGTRLIGGIVHFSAG
jgi:putative nucleotidyltransferase-like protein